MSAKALVILCVAFITTGCQHKEKPKHVHTKKVKEIAVNRELYSVNHSEPVTVLQSFPVPAISSTPTQRPRRFERPKEQILSTAALATIPNEIQPILKCIREGNGEPGHHGESDGIYTIISKNGKWFGGYQMDLPTWASVGGIGSPSEASSLEQDLRAYLLFVERGLQPWPQRINECSN